METRKSIIRVLAHIHVNPKSIALKSHSLERDQAKLLYRYSHNQHDPKHFIVLNSSPNVLIEVFGKHTFSLLKQNVFDTVDFQQGAHIAAQGISGQE